MLPGPERILVIDDSPLIRNLVEDALMDAGFGVLQAPGGEEGIVLATSMRPIVVLCDLSMPGISGLEVVRRLKAVMPNLPIIMFTESIQLRDAVEAMKLGAFGYVNKGVVDHTLINEIQKAIDHRKVTERNEELEYEALRYAREREQIREVKDRQKILEKLLEEKTVQIVRLEQSRAHEDRLSAMGSIVAGIAHEVNNPLAVLKAGLRFLADELAPLCKHVDAETAADITATLSEAEISAGRIQRIIQSVKKLAEESAVQASCDPNEAVTAAWTACRAKLPPAVQLALDVDPTATRIGLSRDDLSLITTNLVSNATQACGLESPRGNVTIRVRSAGGTVTIEVQDDGCGISADNLPQVCNPFFTTKPPGVGIGLGLSLVHQVVKNASGTMQIESVVNAGTVVRLQLPAESSRAAIRSPEARS